MTLTENDLAKAVVDAAFQIHTRLGHGLLESVYEVVLSHELESRGLKMLRQVPVPIQYGSVRFDEGFRADLIVQDKVIVELKSVETILPMHKKQCLTHLRLAGLKLGLLLNLNEALIKNGIVRVVNGLED